jgi:type IV pilus assembly protein PilC
LPAPTLFVIAISEFFVKYWWLIFGGIGGGFYFFMQAWKRNEKCRCSWTGSDAQDAHFRRAGREIRDRPLDTHAVDHVRGRRAAGRSARLGGRRLGQFGVFRATDKIQQEVSTGTSLTAAMTNANLFPTMVLQMCAIGEESGSIDHMLGKAADFYEAEVDDMVAGLSSLMEPIIIVFLGTVIGGIVVSMYLPIFKLGQVV